jgi:glycosyltransferase involved in cell wall biosynthesis
MRAFAEQIVDGLRARGHTVEELTAPVLFSKSARGLRVLSKWLGYLDQFVLFPPLLWWHARALPPGTLFVLADQALSPWISLLSHRSHLVHVHDLLALEAALELQPFHQLCWSGRLYQFWIRRCFRQAFCFLSVSHSTRSALEKQLQRLPLQSEVLLNPLQRRFRPIPEVDAAVTVAQALPALGSKLFLLHVGSVWYKNRHGLLEIWEQLQGNPGPVDLVLVGDFDPSIQSWIYQRPELQPRLHRIYRPSDEIVVALYNLAAALVFPSHAEGFGWPILEAMACGCPVVTTERQPMQEVGGDVVTYIPSYPQHPAAQIDWARNASQKVRGLLERTPAERLESCHRGFVQAHNFRLDNWLDRLEAHYQRALFLQEYR